MRAILQRVKKAGVIIESKLFAEISEGILLLLGIEKGDTHDDLDWLLNKVIQMRIFPDTDQKMNLNIKDTGGEILVISQFTLFASTKKGNRPGFTQAAEPSVANSMYLSFVGKLENQLPGRVKTGVFAADMNVELINQGPVTIFIDTKNKE